MPVKKTVKKKGAPKIEKPETSLADEILNSNDSTEFLDILDATPDILDEMIAEEATHEPPEVAKIPVIDPKPYQPIKTEGVRFYMKEFANTTPHGSVGHDLIWSVKFDEHGMSEFVTEPKVIEKLRDKAGWKVFKA